VSPLPVSPFTDSEWTKEETDYLFRIVHEYDLRWYVIHDRYDYPDGPVRAIEDLKDRYYSVCRKLIRNRPWAGDEPAKSQLLNSYQFDKEREMMRKNYIASLEDRTPDEIAEEEALFVELKRLEQNERKFRKERDDLLRTLLGVDSGLPGIVVEEDGPSALSVEGTKKKKKGTALDFELPPTPSNIIQLGPPVTKRAPPPKSAVYGETEALTQRLQLIRLQTRNTALFASNPP
jgi:DNA methyltransferase 1-associated protein 1